MHDNGHPIPLQVRGGALLLGGHESMDLSGVLIALSFARLRWPESTVIPHYKPFKSKIPISVRCTTDARSLQRSWVCLLRTL